ncbi:zinc finger protein PLAGL1-like [Ornithodoros turicata]|uniref:zinc finger protein PLAGL1-like n=1 Tax=Ornithodoros turicata TaxID=34597 RepID=UPI00313866FC
MRNSDEDNTTQGWPSHTGASPQIQQHHHHHHHHHLHHQASSTTPAPRQFPCPTPGCNRLFSSKFKLVRHSLIHGSERPFKCPSCDRRFHRKDHLKTHQQIHNPNKALHTCEICGKKYSSSLSFRKHTALHAAEAGDPVCRLCGQVFSRREEVMLHLKVHSGSRVVKTPTERRFKCDRCDRSFFTRKDVKRHLVVHTGQRNFVCQFCPQKFGRKDHLVRHTKKTHGTAAVVSPLPTVCSIGKPPTNGVCTDAGPSSTEHGEMTVNGVNGGSAISSSSMMEPQKETWPSLFSASSMLEEVDSRMKQTLPMSTGTETSPCFTIVPHFLPNSYYVGPAVSSPPPPISLVSSLDLGSSLPHFSQAFQ